MSSVVAVISSFFAFVWYLFVSVLNNFTLIPCNNVSPSSFCPFSSLSNHASPEIIFKFCFSSLWLLLELSPLFELLLLLLPFELFALFELLLSLFVLLLSSESSASFVGSSISPSTFAVVVGSKTCITSDFPVSTSYAYAVAVFPNSTACLLSASASTTDVIT